MDTSRTRFVTVNQVAEWLAISPLTVRRMAASEALPAFRVGRVLRFDPADVTAYLARNRSGGEKDAYLKKGTGQPTGNATARGNKSGTAKRQTKGTKGNARQQGRGQAGRPARPLRPKG